MASQARHAETPEGLWQALSEWMLDSWPDIARGRMMSAPALLQEGRVFAFLSTRGGRAGLGCRLGRDYPVASLGLTDWQHLAPFRTRPPMKDWIVAGAGDSPRWPFLAGEALAVARRNRENRK